MNYNSQQTKIGVPERNMTGTKFAANKVNAINFSSSRAKVDTLGVCKKDEAREKGLPSTPTPPQIGAIASKFSKEEIGVGICVCVCVFGGCD